MSIKASVNKKPAKLDSDCLWVTVERVIQSTGVRGVEMAWCCEYLRRKHGDALFDALAEETTGLTPEEIRANLKAHQIDVSPAVNRINKAIEAARARASLQAASARRQTIAARFEQLRQAAVRPLEEAKRRISDVLDQYRRDAVPQAYFNRLQDATTEEDIRSLVEDLEGLNLLREDGKRDAKLNGGG